MPELYCSNKECNPLAPLLTTVKLKRKYVPNLTIGRCSKCKSKFDIEILTDNDHTELQQGDLCPRCHVQLKPEKVSYLECPKCGRHY